MYHIGTWTHWERFRFGERNPRTLVTRKPAGRYCRIPISWYHTPSIATLPHTSNVPQNDVVLIFRQLLIAVKDSTRCTGIFVSLEPPSDFMSSRPQNGIGNYLGLYIGARDLAALRPSASSTKISC